MKEIRNFDPYKVNGKETRRDIGNYRSAAEVSWMSVGKDQLEYASEALKKFRFAAATLADLSPQIYITCLETIQILVHIHQIVRIR
jgi:hypothetical protein